VVACHACGLEALETADLGGVGRRAAEAPYCPFGEA
jgi:hypothetical protein